MGEQNKSIPRRADLLRSKWGNSPTVSRLQANPCKTAEAASTGRTLVLQNKSNPLPLGLHHQLRLILAPTECKASSIDS